MEFTDSDRRPYILRIRDPKKIITFTPFIRKREDGKEGPKIKQLQLQLTDLCNLNCYFCSYGDIRASDVMEPEIFRRSLEIFDPELVILTGGGEPTLYKADSYRFTDAVKEIGKQRKIGMNTNGTYIPEPVEWNNFEWVRISVDANSRQAYKAMKGEDFFGQVLENIVRYCRTDVQNVGIGLLLDKDIVKELPQALQRYFGLWKEYSKLNVQMRTIRDCPDKIPEDVSLKNTICEIGAYPDPQFEKFLEEATNFYEWQDDSRSTLVEEGQSNTAQRCYIPFLEAVVRPNGDIYVCDNTPQRDLSKKIGNVMDDPEAISRRQMELYETTVPERCFSCRYDSMNRILFNSNLAVIGSKYEYTPFI